MVDISYGLSTGSLMYLAFIEFAAIGSNIDHNKSKNIHNVGLSFVGFKAITLLIYLSNQY